MSFFSRRVLPSALTLTALVVATACKDASDANGVNDVRAACEIRVKWKRLGTSDCISCISSAPSVPCECPAFKDFAGKCEEQGNARIREASCNDAIEQCVNDCKTDCACVEGCYAQSEACKRVTAARDGCVADVCASQCD
ncbi:MAG: hypothetical protein KF819_13240 [Labilithrix sp.]|nr:hypothetical protein [Labilithrix sp.]